ncbi:MAG: DUF86 domain-containing protein [Chloroflexi bacterium]|nr:MAG: DUF86 domain-containing protein [Chloroflexota bacterium]
MSRREVTITLRQMLDYSQKTITLSRGRKRSDLDEDLTFNLALTRLVEIIGEAANRVPDEFRNDHSEIPWMEIIGMRNRLIHGYDEVDFDFLWNVIRNDLPGLIKQLNKIL